MKLTDLWPFGRKAKELTYDQIANDDGVGGGYVAGVAVNDKTALQVSTVLACVKVIADGCATPRLNVFRENSRRKARACREYPGISPAFSLLLNEWQTSFEWRLR